MARNTLKACPEGIEQAKAAQIGKGWSQDDLASKVETTRTPVGNFLNGKNVDVKVFVAICKALELDWEVIAGRKNVSISNTPIDATALEALIERARAQVKADIDQRCGSMRVLDMRQPVGLSAIYTDVNILEKITGKTRRDLDELMCGATAETFDRFLLGRVREKRVDGLKAVREQKQLMILGRPGAGKSTFLKRLATLCNRGEFLPAQVPIFVTLKEFAETINQPGLLNFIASAFVPNLAMADVEQLLLQGSGLVLLDGLDEVLEAHHDRVLQEIRDFAQRYAQTAIIITCRIAAREYVFEQFTEVEMANFSDEQIQDFADKWFKTREPQSINAAGTSTTGQLFWQALEQRAPIKELATNPLLLTLLCLEFEESSEFPQSRAELYERGLNVLLSKWDGQRRIRRDEVYRRLPVKRKESLLGQLAMQTFERGEYFFRVHIAERLISQYIENLPDARTDPEALLVDSHAVLKSIEAQHGLLTERATDIYSFSHLTFHEYFAAKNILDMTDPAAQAKALERLVNHSTEKRWREVFLLVAERMDSADYLLMLIKRQIATIVAGDDKLQHFLTWVEQKSRSVETSFSSNYIRAFYFNLGRDRDLAIVRGRVMDLDLDLDLFLILSFAHSFARGRVMDLNSDHAHNLAIELADKIDLAHKNAILDPKLQLLLQQLGDQLPAFDKLEGYDYWWKNSGQTWTEQLRAVMLQHRNIGHDWQFSPAQIELLRQYYDANQLLKDCLSSECYLSRPVRDDIEASLFTWQGYQGTLKEATL